METLLTMAKPNVKVRAVRGRKKDAPQEGKNKRAKKKEDGEDDLPAPKVSFSKDEGST